MALPKRAEPPALHTGLATSPTQLAGGSGGLGKGRQGQVHGAAASTGAQPAPGLPVPEAGFAGFLD